MEVPPADAFFSRRGFSAQLSEHHSLAVFANQSAPTNRSQNLPRRVRTRRFWPRRGPKPDQQFRQVPHTSSLKSLIFNCFLKNSGHRTPFLVVPPEFGLQSMGGGMVIRSRTAGRLNFSLPEVSFLNMPLQVIKHPLFAPIETHGANVEARCRKTTGKAAGTAALQSRYARR